MRVLFNALHSKSGGGVTYLRNMLPRLALSPGVELHVCIHADQRHLLSGDMGGAHIHEMNFRTGFWRLLVREQIEVPKLARRIGADVTFSPANYGPLLAPNPVILLRNALQVGLVERRPAKMAYWALLYLATLASVIGCRRAIAVSGYAMGDLAGRRLGGKFTIVPHGVDPAFFPDHSVGREGFLLAVADLYVQKNLYRLILALARLRQKYPDITLKIAGRAIDREYAAGLHQLVAANRLEGAVEFLGHRDRDSLIDLYRRCMAFVFPSTVETFGNPLVEAMACGAPIISSNSAAMPEVVGNAAEFFDPLDVNAMAVAMERVVKSPDLRAELAGRALKRGAGYSWERTAKSTLDVLRQAALK